MGESSTIKNIPQPRTKKSIVSDLTQLGLKSGMVLLVHSSLSKIGWVNGGPISVIQALMHILGPGGTLVMPTHSGDYSDPADWQNPPVPESWHQVIRDTMPAFDPRRTPTRKMGRIPESFRSWPEVERSSHPQVSFAAWGKHAKLITMNHGISNSLGEQSPLARLYDLHAYVLLLGVGYDKNTSFHLAEYRIPISQTVQNGAPVIENGIRIWKTFADIEFNEHLFPEIGEAFEKSFPVTIGKVGSATCRLFNQRTGVDFAVKWLMAHEG